MRAGGFDLDGLGRVVAGHEAVDGSSPVDEGQVQEPVRGRVDEEEPGEVVQPGLVEPHHNVHLGK